MSDPWLHIAWGLIHAIDVARDAEQLRGRPSLRLRALALAYLAGARIALDIHRATVGIR